MTKIKICGLRESKHISEAANVGVDFVGFVFVPNVRREISITKAQRIINEYRTLSVNNGPKLVGLFANQPQEHVNHIIDFCGLDMIQLCGNEEPEYWNEITVPIIKQIKVADNDSQGYTISQTIAKVDKVVQHGHIPLLDKHESGSFGGTGLSFDWDIAKHISQQHDFILAGGLTPQNVGMATSTVRPWGVDVSSGVEINGTKNSHKIADFANQVQITDTQLFLD